MSEPGSTSLLDVIASDHRAIAELLADPSATGETEHGLALRERLVMDLVRHVVAEEQTLYPAVREHLDGGDALADDGFEQDRALERRLRELEDEQLTADGLGTLWASIGASFADHVARQEPLLRGLDLTLEDDRLAELGTDALGAEQLAPTFPRTVATSSPELNKLTSLVEGFLDRVRDHYARRGVDPGATPSDV